MDVNVLKRNSLKLRIENDENKRLVGIKLCNRLYRENNSLFQKIKMSEFESIKSFFVNDYFERYHKTSKFPIDRKSVV